MTSAAPQSGYRARVAPGIKIAAQIAPEPTEQDVRFIRQMGVDHVVLWTDASKSSAEYKLLREALGQLLTLEVVPANGVLAVAVPHGGRFVKLAERWRRSPLVARLGILIVTVSPEGMVYGLAL